MDNLPKSIRDGLIQAQTLANKRRTRLQVAAGGKRIDVIRAWETGFSVEAGATGFLRGLVDLYDGQRLLSRCLIVTAHEDDGERVYEFKRSTAHSDAPPADYERDPHRPAGLLPET